MILTFDNLVTADEVRVLKNLIARAAFVDGRETAGSQLSQVKQNTQIPMDHPVMPEIMRLVMNALRRNQVFMDATQPRSLAAMLVSRYQPGMQYGLHVDNPLMGDPTLIRSDLSFTLFLSEPDRYEGGELAFDTGSGETAYKLPVGSLICYPTGQLHRVRPLQTGERVAVVGWFQSLIRDPGVRELLHDLSRARSLVHAAEGNSRAFELLNKAFANLVRRYAET